MKTEEELAALKEEVKTLNAKLSELTDEELALISGAGEDAETDAETGIDSEAETDTGSTGVDTAANPLLPRPIPAAHGQLLAPLGSLPHVVVPSPYGPDMNPRPYPHVGPKYNNVFN